MRSSASVSLSRTAEELIDMPGTTSNVEWRIDMRDYSAYLITGAGFVAGVRSVCSDDDEAALRTARQLLVETRFTSIELWDQVRCIGTVDLE